MNCWESQLDNASETTCTTFTAASEPSDLKSSYFITSAMMKPFSKSVWILPAACGAFVPRCSGETTTTTTTITTTTTTTTTTLKFYIISTCFNGHVEQTLKVNGVGSCNTLFWPGSVITFFPCKNIKALSISNMHISSLKIQVSNSITLSQLCHHRVGAHLRIHGPEPTASCRHSTVMWVLGHTCSTYCHYLPGV